MATIQRFEDLHVWQNARQARKEISSLIRTSSIQKDFVLKDQITRAANSVMANIAEGFERGSTQEFVRFLYISKGASGEVRNHLYVALDDEHITQEVFDRVAPKFIEISSQLSKFIAYLDQTEKRSKTAPQPKKAGIQAQERI